MVRKIPKDIETSFGFNIIMAIPNKIDNTEVR